MIVIATLVIRALREAIPEPRAGDRKNVKAPSRTPIPPGAIRIINPNIHEIGKAMRISFKSICIPPPLSIR
jgi:hypothetical protein